MSSSRKYPSPNGARTEDSVFVKIDNTNIERKDRDKRIITLLILASLWTLIFTIIPVIVSFKGIGADIYSM